MNADNPTLERTRQDLARAIALYEGIYLQDRSRSWHGINAVALLCRAARDGLDLPDHPHPGGDAVAYAQALFASIQERRNYREANLYDYATAAEALHCAGREELHEGVGRSRQKCDEGEPHYRPLSAARLTQ